METPNRAYLELLLNFYSFLTTVCPLKELDTSTLKWGTHDSDRFTKVNPVRSNSKRTYFTFL